MQQDSKTDDGRGAQNGLKWFRYVCHADIDELDSNWRIVDRMENTPHGDYSVLCQWMGEGEPK